MAGEVLKERREDLGRSIREISDQLRINADYLTAIENDEFAKLPVAVYTMGYIRSYAKYLDIEAEPIINYYNDNLSQPPHATIIPLAYSQKKSPKIYYVAVLVVCAAAAFFMYRFYALSGQENTAKAHPGETSVIDTVRQGSSEAAEGKGGIEESEHSLDIAAIDTTWIFVRLSDGKTEEMLMRPGDEKSLTFSDRVLLKIGNAGGINVTLDGKDLGVPGESGQVISLALPAE